MGDHSLGMIYDWRPSHRPLTLWTWALVGAIAFLSLTEARVLAGENADGYVSLYVLGSFPSDRGVSFQGGATTGTEVGNGAGAGLKAGVFPELFGRAVGIELESYGHGSSNSFPIASGVGAGTLAQTNLWVFNSMVNLIVRYPGKTVVPYVGVGGGLSNGMLTSANIPGRSDRDFEGSWTFGYQFLSGVQGNLTEKFFLFSEYKYFSAN